MQWLFLDHPKSALKLLSEVRRPCWSHPVVNTLFFHIIVEKCSAVVSLCDFLSSFKQNYRESRTQSSRISSLLFCAVTESGKYETEYARPTLFPPPHTRMPVPRKQWIFLFAGLQRLLDSLQRKTCRVALYTESRLITEEDRPSILLCTRMLFMTPGWMGSPLFETA